MKKLLATLLATTMALSAIGGLVACGGDGTTGGGNNTAIDPDNTSVSYSGELLVWAPNAAHEGYKALIAQHHEFDNVNITFVDQGEGDVKSAIINDPAQSADVFFTESGAIPDLIANNIMQPLVGKYANYATKVKANNSEGSVAGITTNNVVYGFPTTADNTWFMLYNDQAFPNGAPTKLDDIRDTAQNSGKHVYLKYSDGWYLSSFFFGAGCSMDFVAQEGKEELSYVTDVAGANGKIAADAILKYFGPDNTVFKTGTDSFDNDLVTALNNGEAICGFTGTWNLTKIDNEHIKYAMVPEYTINNKDYQLRPFYGVKYCGVNVQRTNKEAAVALAYLMTGEAGQKVRYDTTQALPTNTKVADSAEVKADPLAFMAQQNMIGYPQGKQPDEMYASMTTFANNVANGTITAANVQTYLDTLAHDSYAGDDLTE